MRLVRVASALGVGVRVALDGDAARSEIGVGPLRVGENPNPYPNPLRPVGPIIGDSTP